MTASFRGLFLLSILAATACGEKSANHEIDVVGGLTGKATCQSADAGDGLVAVAPVERQLAFARGVDHHHLLAVAVASPRDTWTYMEQMGVKMFKAPLSEAATRSAQCLVFGFGKDPTEELTKMWRNTEEAGCPVRNGERTSCLLGLYTRVNEAGGRSNIPLIMMRPDGDRWTLVHEFMHFLLGEWAAEHERAIQDLVEEYNSAGRDLVARHDAYKESPQTKLAAYVQAIKTFAPLLYQYHRRVDLEETAVEQHLVELYDSRQLKYVGEAHRENAIRYGLKRAQDVVRNLTVLKMEVQELIASGEEEAKSLEAVLAELAAGLAAIDEVVRGLPAPSTSTTSGLAQFELADDDAHYGCSHHGADAIDLGAVLGR